MTTTMKFVIAINDSTSNYETVYFADKRLGKTDFPNNVEITSDISQAKWFSCHDSANNIKECYRVHRGEQSARIVSLDCLAQEDLLEGTGVEIVEEEPEVININDLTTVAVRNPSRRFYIVISNIKTGEKHYITSWEPTQAWGDNSIACEVKGRMAAKAIMKKIRKDLNRNEVLILEEVA